MPPEMGVADKTLQPLQPGTTLAAAAQAETPSFTVTRLVNQGHVAVDIG
jgi:hypothetical protein